jgi:cytochrome c oxidase subunit 1
MQPVSSGPDLESSRRWFLFAVGSLLLSGLLALILCLARVPFLKELVWDPGLVRRFLVVHVNLGLGVWLHSFMMALFCLLPGVRRSSAGGFLTALSGILLMIISAVFPSADPVLSNYVPVLSHPLFLAGLVLFWGGIVFTLLGSSRLLPAGGPPSGLIPDAAEPGFRAGGIAFILAMAVTAVAVLSTQRGLGNESYYEMLFWGGGHVLLFSSEAVKLAIWIVLIALVTRNSPLSRGWSTGLFGLLLAAPAASLYFTRFDTAANDYRQFFTEAMRWGIFPISLVFLGACIAAVVRAVRRGFHFSIGDVRMGGFVSSALLTILGFVFGAFIRSPSTLVPAHYHASMGAVTVAFMTMAFVLLPAYGFRIPARYERIASWQPAIFGIGQAVFALGFAMAGSVGMGRKIYGQEQQVRGLMDYAGLALVGLGGLIAVIGGVLFLFVITAAVRKGALAARRNVFSTQEDFAWKAQRHIPSRG